jgi:hypothetical protein
MCALGVYLALVVATHGDAHQAKSMFDLINRVDGPKMWLLGLMGLSVVPFAQARLVPRWFLWLGYALAFSLLCSGITYALLLQSLAWTAYIAGLLLLAWVLVLGIIASRTK